MTNFTQEEERFQWLHELQVLIGIGFEPAQGAFLVLHRKKVAISDHRIDSLLAEYANTRVQQRHMPRLSAWAIPSILAKYPSTADEAIERRRAEILQGCAGASKPVG